MDPDRVVAAIATQQHGAMSRRQALDAGLTGDQIHHRLRTGRWVGSRRGVYVVAGAPATERQAVMVAQLATGGVVSHLTAARLWGLDLPAPSTIELIGRQTRQAGTTMHRTSTLAERDVARLGGLVLTAPARTLVDAAGRVHEERLGSVVDDALRRGLVGLAALRECHERVDTGPGRRPTVAMRSVLAERSGDYAAGDSGRELDVLRVLTRAGLPAPVLGHRVRVGRRTYKLDIAWPELRLALEFDGWDTHRTFTAFHGDRQRLRRLVTAGWRIIPVTSQTDLDELLLELFELVCVTNAAA